MSTNWIINPEAVYKPYSSINYNLVKDERIFRYLKHLKHLMKYKKLLGADVYDMVGHLSGYEVIDTGFDCGGYCDMTDKVIGINFTNTNERENSFLTTTISHELAHTIQVIINPDIYTKSRTLSEELRIEQQAETMAFFIHRIIYPNLPLGELKSYFKLKDLIWLNNWNDGRIQNDLLISCAE
jgi:hypothetical protein